LREYELELVRKIERRRGDEKKYKVTFKIETTIYATRR